MSAKRTRAVLLKSRRGTHATVKAYQRTETGKGSATEAPCWNRRSTHGLRGRIPKPTGKRRKQSAKSRAKIAAAQRRRWAKVRAKRKG
jgi:hypothetical protein